MQARTASNAVEWYTFLRNTMGWRRTHELQINVPDLNINLVITDPFKKLEVSQSEAQCAEGDDTEGAVLKTMREEQAVAENLIRECLDQLKDSPEWADVIASWIKDQRIGLAWRRYDRLEWIQGANERKMYGTIAMQKSHELELRPKSHYPTTTLTRKKRKTLTEPVPVEGFLIRLTGQRGRARRLGLMFHKQLYFSTHDQFLVFSRPPKSAPPPPPRLPAAPGGQVPSSRTVRDQAPDTWAINPYPMKDNQIEWLSEGSTGTPETRRLHDEEAADEADRKAHNLINCDGYIDLADVKKVRKAKKGATPVDDEIESGSEVDFDEEVEDTTADDGVTKEFDIERTFELVMRNGLIVRLQVSKIFFSCIISLTECNRLRTSPAERNGSSTCVRLPNTGGTAPPPTSPSTKPRVPAISQPSTSTKKPKPTSASSQKNGKSRNRTPHRNCTISAALPAAAAST